jgi:hypothetical protein
MNFDISKLAFAALLLLAPAAATTVNRCEDSSGRITFTTLGCPAGHSLQQQETYNAPPGSVIATPLSTPQTQPRAAKPEREIVVVGQHDDGCGNVLSAHERRRAMINLQTPAGMSKRDVESMLGKPDKVSVRNQEVRYVYDNKDEKNKTMRGNTHRKQQVTFDKNGCVKKS